LKQNYKIFYCAEMSDGELKTMETDGENSGKQVYTQEEIESMLKSPPPPADDGKTTSTPPATAQGGIAIVTSPENVDKNLVVDLTKKLEKMATSGEKGGDLSQSKEQIVGEPSRNSAVSDQESVGGRSGGVEDDVFEEKLVFPKAYKKVRAMRMASAQTVKLGGVGGGGGWARRLVTTTPSGLVGFDVPDDDRQFQVVNYHIPALKKNVSTSVKKLMEGSSQLVCVTCPEQHFFTGREPVVVIISDQHFPPSLPSNSGQCTVVIRCKDPMLFELPGLLREFFAGADGRISLLEGSVVLYGSLSHLAARGLDNYADEVVRTGKTIGSMVGGRGVTTPHNICVPLGGICSTGLIRMMLDLDCWLQSGETMSPYSLARSRNKLWDLLLEHGNIRDTADGSHDERIYYLPESTTSNRKIRFVAPALPLGLPTKLTPMSSSNELKLIEWFLGELNKVFRFTLDTAS
jgi:hypothetical protein